MVLRTSWKLLKCGMSDGCCRRRSTRTTTVLNKQPCYSMCLHRAGFIKGAGGISPVDCPGVENVNLSNLIAGHFDYATKIQEIVELLHLE